MCGIAGIIGRIDGGNRSALQRMSCAMLHRGPDDHGSWESAPDDRGGGLMLAHRRLSILDLASTGRQPMVDPVTGHVLVFNGEIYNYKALRQQLTDAGHTFQSSGDTAVMLRALGVRGRDAVRELRGMFAFAAWDPVRRVLLLARDPLGMKPLYLAVNRQPGAEWVVAFASEVRALLASGLLPGRRLRPEAVASVVWNGFVVGPQTAVEGIESLRPGELREFEAGGGQTRSEDYWAIPPRPRSAPADEDQVTRLLEEDVRLHLVSDVPLAVFLSGGIDSSAVANLARKAASAPIHTFTMAFEEGDYDEGPVARRVAAAIGTEHSEVVLSRPRFEAQLDAAIDSLDQPTFDGLNAYYLSRAIRDAGYTVALAGTGGDELFGGYRSFRDLPALQRWSRRLRWTPTAARVAGAKIVAGALGLGSVFAPQSRWAKLPEMVGRAEELLWLYQMAYALFLPEFQRELLRSEDVEDGLSPGLRARLAEETRERTPLSAISVMEHRLFLGERLLRDNDAASMASSIEQRLPLVDSLLFETVDRLPDDARFRPVGRKALLRRIGLRGLDPVLFDRPKCGFVLPFERWIRAGLDRLMDGTLRDPVAVGRVGLDPGAVLRLWKAFLDGAPGVYWSRVWSLYVLVRWCHRNGVLL